MDLSTSCGLQADSVRREAKPNPDTGERPLRFLRGLASIELSIVMRRTKTTTKTSFCPGSRPAPAASQALYREEEDKDDDDQDQPAKLTRPPVPLISTRPPLGRVARVSPLRAPHSPGNSVVSPSLVGGRVGRLDSPPRPRSAEDSRERRQAPPCPRSAKDSRERRQAFVNSAHVRADMHVSDGFSGKKRDEGETMLALL